MFVRRFAGGTPVGFGLGYGPVQIVSVGSKRTCLTFSATIRISCFTPDGRKELELSQAAPAVRVTDEGRRRWKDAMREYPGYYGGQRPTAEQMAQADTRMRDQPFAEVYPAVSQVIQATTGDIWVRRYMPGDGITRPGSPSFDPSPSDSTEWLVYDAAGKPLATVRLPPHFQPFEIGTDYVAGVQRDEDDVESIVVHVLRHS